jgi:antitoxin component YwqK of YwqJK toxin-antitoxin module
MTYLFLILCSALTFIATSCRPCRQNDIVQETYIHKYGVPIDKEDWTRNGKEGQVVLLHNDGVTVSKTYEKGILHGKTTYTFPNSSTLARIETYVNGDLVSKIENYLSGIAKEEERFVGQQLSEHLCWYEDGTPSAIEKYENGYLVAGEYRSPFNDLESKVASGEGIRITRGNDGEILFKDTIEEGQMVERISYFPSGDPSSVTPFQHGLAHGTRLTYSQGGLPATVEEWAHGMQEGATTVYLNGEKIAIVPYAKGKREGIEQRFRDGQLLVEEVTWKNDKQHGPRKIILEGGESKTEWYHEGEVVSRSTFERMNLTLN